MKTCEYCGRENDDTILQCSECGTSLTPDSAGKFSNIICWRPQMSSAQAICRGLGCFLISTAIFFLIGRITVDVSPADTDLNSFYEQFFRFPFPVITEPILFVGLLTFTFSVCYSCCQKQTRGVLTSIIVIILIFLETIGPEFFPNLIVFYFLVPMVMIGLVIHASIAYYIGALLQLLLGVWLLGWLGPRRTVK